MTFRYSQYPGIDGEYVYRPSIPITLQVGRKNVYLEALIDSGADNILLPIELASVFGFRLADQPRHRMEAAGGNVFYIYSSPERVRFILKCKGFRSRDWFSKVYFTESQPTILLGQKGFLDQFKIVLDGPSMEVRID